MPDDLKKTAIVYDFDGTLARGNLQECSFIPKMNLTREEFWDEVKTRTRTEDADEILVYMHLMLEKAKENSVEVTKQMLREHGEHANLFNGPQSPSVVRSYQCICCPIRSGPAALHRFLRYRGDDSWMLDSERLPPGLRVKVHLRR